jgi:hypothetical protein
MAHQDEDPRNLLIVAVGLGSVVTIVGSMFGLYSYYGQLRNQVYHDRVQAIVSPDLTALRERESKTLTSYAYLNKEKTQVRIPVDQAMKLLAQKGRDAIPTIQPAAPASASAPTPAPAPASSAPVPDGQDKKDDGKKDEKKSDEKKEEKKEEKKDDKKDKKDRPLGWLKHPYLALSSLSDEVPGAYPNPGEWVSPGRGACLPARFGAGARHRHALGLHAP